MQLSRSLEIKVGGGRIAVVLKQQRRNTVAPVDCFSRRQQQHQLAQIQYSLTQFFFLLSILFIYFYMFYTVQNSLVLPLLITIVIYIFCFRIGPTKICNSPVNRQQCCERSAGCSVSEQKWNCVSLAWSGSVRWGEQFGRPNLAPNNVSSLPRYYRRVIADRCSWNADSYTCHSLTLYP